MQFFISSEQSAILQTLMYINAHEHSIDLTRMELYNNGASVFNIAMCRDLKKNTKQISANGVPDNRVSFESISLPYIGDPLFEVFEREFLSKEMFRR